MTVIIVNDKMQQGYEYCLSAPEGRDFAPDFCPELTPEEMLKLGVFEGHYLNDCQNEFPKFWFVQAKLSLSGPNEKMNWFGVKSRLSLDEWRQKGWIIYPDVRGWFQWYCRYYMEGEFRRLMPCKLNDGKLFADIWLKLKKIVMLGICIVESGNVKHCCNGLIIRFFEI